MGPEERATPRQLLELLLSRSVDQGMLVAGRKGQKRADISGSFIAVTRYQQQLKRGFLSTHGLWTVSPVGDGMVF